MTAKPAIQSALVTGAAGFLGNHIAAIFEEKGCQITGVDRIASPAQPNLTILELESEEFSALLKKTKPGVLIHAAGGASVPFSMQNPREDFRSGPDLLSCLLDRVRTASPQTRVVFLSSAAVYGNPERLPITEGDPAKPISAYGFHKRMAEILCREYWQVYGVHTAIVRIFSAYGEGLRKQVLWDLCQRLSTMPRSLSLHGNGSESRDFLHARDAARGIFAIASGSAFEANIYNLASGEETTIRELADILVDAFGEKSNIAFDGVVPQGDPRNWRADISRIHALGFAPEIPLATGVRHYVDWYRKQQP